MQCNQETDKLKLNLFLEMISRRTSQMMKSKEIISVYRDIRIATPVHFYLNFTFYFLKYCIFVPLLNSKLLTSDFYLVVLLSKNMLNIWYTSI